MPRRPKVDVDQLLLDAFTKLHVDREPHADRPLLLQLATAYPSLPVMWLAEAIADGRRLVEELDRQGSPAEEMVYKLAWLLDFKADELRKHPKYPMAPLPKHDVQNVLHPLNAPPRRG